MGTYYSGFQIQQNANSIQSEIGKALKIFFKADFLLTGASRTDAGVHALRNYFHFDSENMPSKDLVDNIIYNLNAILPEDIVVKQIFKVGINSHSRFDAVAREYKYFIYQNKNPFLKDRAYYYPYKLDINKLQVVAELLTNYVDFSSFAKKNTQVKTNNCNVIFSKWLQYENQLIYNVKANRFLRGMVRGLVGTMLKVGSGRTTIEEFIDIIDRKDYSKADFSVPPQGLFLIDIEYL